MQDYTKYNYYESCDNFCFYCHKPLTLRQPINGGEFETMECTCTENQKRINDKCAICGRSIEYKPLEFGGKVIQIIRIDCECERKTKEAEATRIRQEQIATGSKHIRDCWLKNSKLPKRLQSCTFENFIPSNAQMAAFKTAISFNPNNGEHTGIIFSGGVGCGKTHISAAIANNILTTRQINDERAVKAASDNWETAETPVLFISVTNLLRELRKSYDDSQSSESDVINRYKCTGLLILDDLGAEKSNDWASDRLFEIIDHRYNECLPIVITTNCVPAELKKRIGDRLFDRLRSMCYFVAIADESHRTTAKQPNAD